MPKPKPNEALSRPTASVWSQPSAGHTKKFLSDTTGNNAHYIPYLAQVASELFGTAVVSVDDQVFEIGDVKYSFSIQSISKAYTLALAMEELGYDRSSSGLVRSRPAVRSIPCWLW